MLQSMGRKYGPLPCSFLLRWGFAACVLSFNVVYGGYIRIVSGAMLWIMNTDHRATAESYESAEFPQVFMPLLLHSSVPRPGQQDMVWGSVWSDANIKDI